MDLNQTVEGMLKMLGRLIGEDIDLVWRPGADVGSVNMDRSQIDQLLVNLCVNARDAIGDTGKATIETSRIVLDDAYCADHSECAPGEYALLAVSDTGCGIAPELLPHLFEPFFTTKEMGKGTGLGLATVYGIVKQNNGLVEVFSEPGRGTTFRVCLPRHRGKAEQRGESDPAGPVPRGSETILVVEDEAMILDIAKTMLELQGYTVLAAATPGEAVRLAREHAGEIHLLITDVVMPEMNGRELAKKLLSLYPGLKRLFMSGYTANVIAHHGVLDEGVHFMQKPFTLADLVVKVREALEIDAAESPGAATPDTVMNNPALIDHAPCPCGSTAAYADCCSPALAGRIAAPTAEALMRSRYTAYVAADVAYLLRTWHARTRPAAIDPATIPRWRGLEILRTEQGREEGTVRAWWNFGPRRSLRAGSSISGKSAALSARPGSGCMLTGN